MAPTAPLARGTLPPHLSRDESTQRLLEPMTLRRRADDERLTTGRTRRELLVLAAATASCAGGRPSSALRVSDRHAPQGDLHAGDAADAPAVLRDVAGDLDAAVSEDASSFVDAARDTEAASAIDATADAALSDVVDAEAMTDAVDAVDAVDASLPCGLEELYQPSVRVLDVPMNGGVVDLSIHVVVARDARGIYAFSAVCPHEGCIVQITERASSHCPCHDSRFDDDGDWVEGPAMRPLLNHPVAVCDGRVWVDRSLGVPIGTRTSG